jgi:hypothetical protein
LTFLENYFNFNKILTLIRLELHRLVGALNGLSEKQEFYRERQSALKVRVVRGKKL